MIILYFLVGIILSFIFYFLASKNYFGELLRDGTHKSKDMYFLKRHINPFTTFVIIFILLLWIVIIPAGIISILLYKFITNLYTWLDAKVKDK